LLKFDRFVEEIFLVKFENKIRLNKSNERFMDAMVPGESGGVQHDPGTCCDRRWTALAALDLLIVGFHTR